MRSMMEQQVHDLRFAEGSTHLVVGASGCGKTSRMHAYLRLKNDLFQHGDAINHVIFFYAVWQEEYTQMQQEGLVQEWVNAFPSNEEFLARNREHERTICVLDDAMNHISRDLVEIVTVSARHSKATTFLLFQSLFPAHPLARQISLNVKYFHLFKNPRENAQIQILARQLQPRGYRYIVEAYHEATKKPYSCFIVDLLQETADEVRYRSNVLPDEWPMIAWVAKGTTI